jgi:hypothetical protein
MSLCVRQITPNDVALIGSPVATFGDAFDDVDTHRESAKRRLPAATTRQ